MGSTTYVDKMLLISYYEAIGNGIKEWFGILTAEVDARVQNQNKGLLEKLEK